MTTREERIQPNTPPPISENFGDPRTERFLAELYCTNGESSRRLMKPTVSGKHMRMAMELGEIMGFSPELTYKDTTSWPPTELAEAEAVREAIDTYVSQQEPDLTAQEIATKLREQWELPDEFPYEYGKCDYFARPLAKLVFKSGGVFPGVNGYKEPQDRPKRPRHGV